VDIDSGGKGLCAKGTKGLCVKDAEFKGIGSIGLGVRGFCAKGLYILKVCLVTLELQTF
jgi:hypothetical protein